MNIFNLVYQDKNGFEVKARMASTEKRKYQLESGRVVSQHYVRTRLKYIGKIDQFGDLKKSQAASHRYEINPVNGFRIIGKRLRPQDR